MITLFSDLEVNQGNIMKALYIYLIVISQTYNCFARSNTPELNLQNISQMKVAQKIYLDNLKKCNVLLESTPSKSIYTEALKFVLKHRMPSPRIFEELGESPIKDSIQFRLKIAQLITKQSLELQKLITLTNKNDIKKFNETSQLMLKQFDSIEKLLNRKKRSETKKDSHTNDDPLIMKQISSSYGAG